jgi:AcrR family transcriptional regulator
MNIPLPETGRSDTRREWTTLDGPGKRERLLLAAHHVFSDQGLEAPMSEVAAAAGAGVASVYRLFESKHELLAALVVRRNDQVAAAAGEALRRPGNRWAALTEMITELVEAQSTDDFLGEARLKVGDHPDVHAARARTARAVERLFAAARQEGRLRADATPLDLRLLFAATRAARQIEPDAWRRTLALMIDALDAQAGPTGAAG